jgi:DNA-binding HxlR family transcriptional regulator
MSGAYRCCRIQAPRWLYEQASIAATVDGGLRGREGATVAKRLATYYHCPTEFTLAVLGGKWKTVILSYLKERPCRYAELRRLVPRLSDKVLSERLRDLTRSGLVARQEPTGTHTQTYCLTERGRSLSELLQQLYTWGLNNSGSFGVRVGGPLEELDAQQKETLAVRSARHGNRARLGNPVRVRGS